MTEENTGALPAEETIEETTPNAEQLAEPATAEQTPEQIKAAAEAAERRNIRRLVSEKFRAKAQADQERARADRLEQELQMIRQMKQPAQADISGAPRLDQFESFERFQEARDAYIERNAKQAALSAVDQHIAERQEAAHQNEMRRSFQQRMEKFRSVTPDFEEVVDGAEVVIPHAVGVAIMESDIGPSIAYYLAKNQDEAERISRLSPTAAIRAIGKIEAKLESAEQKPAASSAPKPVDPVSGKGRAVQDPDKMSADEWLQWRTAQIRKKRNA